MAMRRNARVRLGKETDYRIALKQTGLTRLMQGIGERRN
jgi:hypothetical protein